MPSNMEKKDIEYPSEKQNIAASKYKSFQIQAKIEYQNICQNAWANYPKLRQTNADNLHKINKYQKEYQDK